LILRQQRNGRNSIFYFPIRPSDEMRAAFASIQDDDEQDFLSLVQMAFSQ
jgi:hypothetical protein